ncbi:hypothetical protein ASF49_12635 [Methylobacterium sp. Leaf104]|uniref:hypothetical protein n=1 Tax=Methylobacterium TaxID=407 RepID=UPI0006F5E12B|nr:MULTISPECIES: hypothetical protein [Methylobacterium]KQP30815.1 hypothetical protein ASF49_12635 [Methylobacterium sp. Leaf104]MCI9882193.1 hypothetical protein [Methylobacterium goesingense]
MATAVTSDRTVAVPEPRPGAGGAILRWRSSLSRSAWPILGAAGLYLLLHPYEGIDGDARIYVGRALADLDPDGVGRDLMFTHDGQSRFSLFPLVLRGLVAALGPGPAALSVSLVGLIAWFCAASVLAGTLEGGRRRWIVLVALAVLPASYGQPGVFRIGEAMATPRTLAEAAVLAGLAASLSGRRALAAAFVGLGGLIHPIMGLAGLAVLVIALVAENRRWLLVLVPTLAAVLVAAGLGVPLFARLLQPVDPEFLGILRQRCADLFPMLWPSQAWGPPAVQAASILVAATLVPTRARRVLLAALLAGACGVAATAVFEEQWSSLLVIQVQPWRFLWVTSVLGAAAFGLCVAILSRGPAGDRITLALLGLAWVYATDLPIGGGAGLLAVGIHAAVRRARLAPSRALMVATLSVVGLLVASRLVIETLAFASLLGDLTEGAHPGLGLIRNFPIVPPLAFTAGLAWIAAGRIRAAIPVLALVLVLALVVFWDQRSPAFRRIEDRTLLPGLVAAIASRPGEVLWLDGRAETWLALGRPSWITNLQGASIVFSRPLAMLWSERIARLIALGLATEAQRTPFAPPVPLRADDLPAGGVATLCAAPDAPAWIVAPLGEGRPAPAGARVYPLADPLVTPMAAVDGLTWQRVTAYGLLACRP